MFGEKKRNVVITGCDSGFGKNIALRLGETGHFNVFAGCYTEEGKESLNEETGDDVYAFQMDVTNEDSVSEGKEFVSKYCKDGIYALINNAGIFRSGNLDMSTKFDWEIQLNVNVVGVATVTKAFLSLIEKGEDSRIINLASIAGRFATPGVSGYNASKFAVEGLSDAWRRELSKRGIKVIMVEPGIMKNTRLFEESLKQTPEKTWNALSDELKEYYGFEYFEEGYKKGNDMIQKMGGDAVTVVDALETAVMSKNPKTRYLVGKLDAPLFIAFSYLPTFLADICCGFLMKGETPAALKNKK